MILTFLRFLSSETMRVTMKINTTVMKKWQLWQNNKNKDIIHSDDSDNNNNDNNNSNKNYNYNYNDDDNDDDCNNGDKK